MSSIEGVRNLNPQREQRLVVQGTARDLVFQGHTIQKLHGNEALSLVSPIS